MSDYMDYSASVYKRDKVEELVKEYTAKADFSLQQPEDWDVFVKHIHGITNPQFQQLLDQKEIYQNLYGIEVVDQKLYKEFNLSLDIKAMEKAPDYKG